MVGRPGETYNIGTDLSYEVTMKQLADILIEKVSYDIYIYICENDREKIMINMRKKIKELMKK